MSEQQPQPKKGTTNLQVIGFVVILSFVCALILSILSSALKKPQEIAQELDRSEQMMIAAKIFTHEGYFQIKNDKGQYIPAKYAGDGKLVPGSKQDKPTRSEILEVYKKRIVPVLVNDQGKMTTFKKAGINEDQYLAKYKKTGYSQSPEKLIYEILPNPTGNESKKPTPIGYVIPVNGFGLWDAIYGYLAIEPDGETVIGISWYEQKETPGTWSEYRRRALAKTIFSERKSFNPDPKGKSILRQRLLESLWSKEKSQKFLEIVQKQRLQWMGCREQL